MTISPPRVSVIEWLKTLERELEAEAEGLDVAAGGSAKAARIRSSTALIREHLRYVAALEAAATTDAPEPPPAPSVVNKFAALDAAVEAAKIWSRDRVETFTVIHAPSETGLAYFVERGDGGMIRSTERKIGTWTEGRRQKDE